MPAPAPTPQCENIRKIASLAGRYCRENLFLPHFSEDSLEKDWWSGVRLFLNHSFFQGRRDEVSEKVEAAAMPILERYFKGKSVVELATTDCKSLEKDLSTVIGKGKVGKARDVKMLVNIFTFLSTLSEKNLTLYSLEKIRQGKLAEHYYELQTIRQIGPKIASFYLRDLVCIYELDALIKKDELKFLQPIDVWLRKVAHKLDIITDENCAEETVRSNIIEACDQCGVSTFGFNQGAWYLGKNAFDILIEQLDKITFDEEPHRHVIQQ